MSSGIHLNGLGGCWPVTQGAVRPCRIRFLAPTLYQDLGLLQGIENLPVEQLISQLPVEALGVTVFPGTTRFNGEYSETP